jgi:hypothetical protein
MVDDNKPLIYEEVMEEGVPESPIDFMEAKTNRTIVPLYSYGELEFIMMISIPDNLEIEQLQAFVRRATQIEHLILFDSPPNSKHPNALPLVTVPRQITHCFFLPSDPPTGSGFKSVYVHFSEDSYRKTDRRCFFLKHPISIAGIKERMQDLIRGREVRFCIVNKHEITRVLTAIDTSLQSVDGCLKCDVVPDDQKLKGGDPLVKVSHAIVEGDGFFKLCGFPFLLAVGARETAQALRKKLQAALGKSDTEMTHIRLVAASQYAKFAQDQVLKGEQIVRNSMKLDSLLLVGSSDTSARRAGESFKLYN